MSENPTPNWYPDPSGDSELRWWDGIQWTEFTHSSQAALAPVQGQAHAPKQSLDPVASQLQKKPRKKFWVLLTAGVASLALVTTAAIAIPAMMGGSETAPTAEPMIVNGFTYMPPIEIDLSKERNALFPANVDLTELHRSLEAAGEPVNYYNGVLDIYADRDLTVPVHAYESTFDASRGSGKM